MPLMFGEKFPACPFYAVMPTPHKEPKGFECTVSATAGSEADPENIAF